MEDKIRCKECGKTAEPEDLCPNCGIHLIFGYGLAGGGMGSYGMCDSCDYARKAQDPEAARVIEEASK